MDTKKRIAELEQEIDDLKYLAELEKEVDTLRHKLDLAADPTLIVYPQYPVYPLFYPPVHVWPTWITTPANTIILPGTTPADTITITCTPECMSI